MSILFQANTSLDSVNGFTEKVIRKFYLDNYGIPESEVNVEFNRWNKSDFMNSGRSIKVYAQSDYNNGSTLPSFDDVLREANSIRELFAHPEKFNLSHQDINRMVVTRGSFGNVFRA